MMNVLQLFSILKRASCFHGSTANSTTADQLCTGLGTVHRHAQKSLEIKWRIIRRNEDAVRPSV